MNYVCNSCNSNYQINMPGPMNVEYVPSSNSVNYSISLNTPRGAYYEGRQSSLYSSASSNVSNSPSPKSESPSPKVIEPKKVDVISPTGEKIASTVYSDVPIEELMEQFIPKEKDIRYNDKPTMDINEIERAINKVANIAKFEVEKEIIIRRKVVNKDPSYDN